MILHNQQIAVPPGESNTEGPKANCAEVIPIRCPAALNRSTSRDEMNLAEFPLAVLSTRVNSDIKTLEFSDFSRSPSGDLIERKWIITGADKFGLPTSTDDDVLLGLIRLTMDQGFRHRKVYFTRYELLKILQWSTEGRSYTRLIKSLDRLSGVRIRSSNSFYDNVTKSFQTCNFGLIDAYEINDERAGRNLGKSEIPRSFFIWSEMLFDSFKAGYIKKLDLNLYFSLKSAVSRRLYRYLDKHFYYRSVLDVPLLILAFEKLGVSRSYRYVSSVKQQLEPAFKELIKVGFLSMREYHGCGEQTIVRLVSGVQGENKGIQNATNVSRKPFKLQASTPLSAPKTNPDIADNRPEMDTTLLSLLIERGIAEAQAKRLLSGKSVAEFEKIMLIVKYYDHLLASSDRRVSKNSVGFLYRAVENPSKFVLPPAFSSSLPKNNSGLREHSPKPLNSPSGNSKAVDAKKTAQNVHKQRAEELMKRMPPEQLKALYSSVHKKMSCLKGVLSAEGYKEAVLGCVKEEVLRLSK